MHCFRVRGASHGVGRSVCSRRRRQERAKRVAAPAGRRAAPYLQCMRLFLVQEGGGLGACDLTADQVLNESHRGSTRSVAVYWDKKSTLWASVGSVWARPTDAARINGRLEVSSSSWRRCLFRTRSIGRMIALICPAVYSRSRPRRRPLGLLTSWSRSRTWG